MSLVSSFKDAISFSLNHVESFLAAHKSVAIDAVINGIDAEIKAAAPGFPPEVVDAVVTVVKTRLDNTL